MELVPTPDQGPSGPLSGEPGPSGPQSGERGPSGTGPGGTPSPALDLTRWLAGVERRLAALDERLGRVEVSIRPMVAEEVHGATNELRRAMTELGRRLVQDLPHELARHRDAIVAELRPPPPPPSPPSPSPPPAPDPEIDDAASDLAPAPAPAPAPEPTDSDDAARPRSPRRRRRHG